MAINIDKKQRMAMITNGMNPLNENHVRQFLSGKGVSSKEIQERALAMIGDIANKSLGHAGEVDRAAPVGEWSGESTIVNRSENIDIKEMIKADMNDYVNNSSSGSISSGELMSLRESPQPVQNINAQSLKANGDKLATDYYNTFIKSLQNPSPSANLAVFQALKTLLEYELKIKKSHGEQARQILNESVASVTRKMYQNLKG